MWLLLGDIEAGYKWSAGKYMAVRHIDIGPNVMAFYTLLGYNECQTAGHYGTEVQLNCLSLDNHICT